MTPEQIALVQKSFAAVVPIADQAAALFYERLFEEDPALRPLFAHSDMAAQGRKLMQALGFVVGSLNKPEALMPVACDLAMRHVGYGVRAEHYGTVGSALLWTLGQGLGAAFTPAVHQAWATAYGSLAAAMIEAAYTARAA